MRALIRLAVWAGLASVGSACAAGSAAPPVRTPPAQTQPAQTTPAAAAAAVPVALPARGPQPVRALIIGGGPTKVSNQVAIESNVRYVGRLLPATAQYRVLFTDGDLESENVQYRAENRSLAYRAPNLPRLDGAANLSKVRVELTAVARDARARPDADVFLYFTGHGSPDRPSRFANNWFDLWSGGRLTVAELSRSLSEFPVGTPITLVMVQCFSGAFGNVLFEGGRPDGAPIDQHIAGFFAAVPERVAAGCTPAINEADYKDFTSYFFAALTGEDRLGRRVSGADYDADGRVGMDEAFAWTLVHDDSIDTPVCTSDAFLRRFSDVPDASIAPTSYATLRSWATVAQRAALDGLADAVRLTGDDRLQQAFARVARMRPNSMRLDEVRLIRFVNLARSVARAHALRESGDPTLQRRYASLLLAESRNPLRSAVTATDSALDRH